MARTRDYAYEALAEATGSDMTESRGELNAALKSINEQNPELENYPLADEIHRRAKLYRQIMGDDVILTPSALAKHWKRVFEESTRPRPATNQSVLRECETCGGDRFVVVSVRSPQESPWMREHGIVPSDQIMEELSPCPDCNGNCKTIYRRYDGSTAFTPDPARTREMMRS